MNGIEVLNVIKGYTNYPAMIGVTIMLSMLASVLTFMIITLIKEDIDTIKNFLVGCIIYFIIFMTIFCGTNLFKINTQYQITVLDNVSFNEFNNKYEIISQNGKIYTVEERKE